MVEPIMLKLNLDQQAAVQEYLGLIDIAIAKLQQGRFDECAQILNGRSMDHIIKTIEQCDVYQLEQLRNNHSWTYDSRVLVAVKAVMIQKNGMPGLEKWELLDSDEYGNLPANSDQDSAIQKVLGVTAAQADLPLVKFELGFNEDCARILNGRSIEHILSTLRPLDSDKLDRLLNSYISLDLEKKYGCHVLLSTEAIIRSRSGLSEVKEAFKMEYARFYDDFTFEKKKIFCDEMGIMVL